MSETPNNPLPNQDATSEPIAKTTRRRFLKPFLILLAAFALGAFALIRRIVSRDVFRVVGVAPDPDFPPEEPIELAGDVCYESEGTTDELDEEGSETAREETPEEVLEEEPVIRDDADLPTQ